MDVRRLGAADANSAFRILNSALSLAPDVHSRSRCDCWGGDLFFCRVHRFLLSSYSGEWCQTLQSFLSRQRTLEFPTNAPPVPLIFVVVAGAGQMEKDTSETGLSEFCLHKVRNLLV